MADTAQARQKAGGPTAGSASGSVAGSAASGAKGGSGGSVGSLAGSVGAGLIGGAYSVELARKLPLQGGGLPAFVAKDHKGVRDGLMAVQARRGVPARAQPLAALQDAAIPGLASPLAHGVAPGVDGVPSYFVICPAPPGAPLGTGMAVARSWTEAELLACVLRPVAACLAALQALGATHRAIRADNVFQPGAGQRVTLGAAWAVPPASLQPAAFEPPYVALCLRSGRGEGSIADDVYALGVLLLALATGAMPLAGLEDGEIVRRKLALGSFAALGGERAPSPAIADLVRGMLAEDPDHRPSPLQLGDPETARSRRVAARPVRLAQRPLEVDGQTVLTTRALAGALATAPAGLAAPVLREGHVDRWLRRALGDPASASRVEEILRARALSPPDDIAADALLVARAVAALDPLAPLCWRGLAFWPDGLGAAVAEADPDSLAELRLAISTEAVAAWAAMRPDRCDPAVLRVEARQHRAILLRRGWVGGIGVLRCVLNPLAGCTSRMLGRQLVVRIADLLPALEEEASRPDRQPAAQASGPVDAELAAFIVARQDLRLDRELGILAEPRTAEATETGAAALAQIQVLARLQERVQAPPVPALAAWLAAGLRPAFVVWQSRSRRRELEASLDERVASGRLEGLLELVDNPPLRAQDEREAAEARTAVARIDATLATLQTARDHHVATSRRVGQEVAAAIGVIAASSMALWLAL